LRSRLHRLAFAQQTARHAQRSFGLFDVDGFGQDEVRADAERFRYPGLTFHDGYGKRRLVGRRIARAFEQQRGVLLVIAVDHKSVEMIAHQLLHCRKRLSAGLDVKFQLA
jgi:hypothetical protein